jgi:hypothetical protein
MDQPRLSRGHRACALRLGRFRRVCAGRCRQGAVVVLRGPGEQGYRPDDGRGRRLCLSSAPKMAVLQGHIGWGYMLDDGTYSFGATDAPGGNAVIGRGHQHQHAMAGDGGHGERDAGRLQEALLPQRHLPRVQTDFRDGTPGRHGRVQVARHTLLGLRAVRQQLPGPHLRGAGGVWRGQEPRHELEAVAPGPQLLVSCLQAHEPERSGIGRRTSWPGAALSGDRRTLHAPQRSACTPRRQVRGCSGKR